MIDSWEVGANYALHLRSYLITGRNFSFCARLCTLKAQRKIWPVNIGSVLMCITYLKLLKKNMLPRYFPYIGCFWFWEELLANGVKIDFLILLKFLSPKIIQFLFNYVHQCNPRLSLIARFQASVNIS